ncbi:hypothetical protein KUTeg_021572 [Tegillarca granosa]|uniref:Aromatic-L-amino-acid decarboxylase n=1 Tax=Tegillarca granosa TaxID=220873 RepID=A0ABQ9E3P7_TEGGR|nr:hypothetical protein KUTeg_021572 [Tegillarca granosa]
MDADEFRKRGREMIDYVADYLENIRDRRPLPSVQPGFMKELLPDHAPENPEKWEDVFKDIERVIMPGVTHWHNPQFHAYFPTSNSYPGILADILSDAIGCIGFSWASSPSCTELEVIVMDWLGKLLDLPKEFLFCSGGRGGGVIQGTASEATLVALLSARSHVLHRLKEKDPNLNEAHVMSRLVAYCSDQSHSSVERAGLIGAVQMKKIETDEKSSLRGSSLRDMIESDQAKGLIPFFRNQAYSRVNNKALCYSIKLGEQNNIWMHIDAAYAGSAFICPEFRPLLNGYAMSFNFNPHKWMLVNFDCSAMVKDSKLVSEAFTVDPLYLQHENQGKMPDYRHWHIPLGRRFRSLKVWFVLRLYGLKGLQEYIRKDVRLAHEFENFVKDDNRFEIFGEVILGLIEAINDDGRIHLVPSKVKDTYFLRFAICASRTNSDDVKFAWENYKFVHLILCICKQYKNTL